MPGLRRADNKGGPVDARRREVQNRRASTKRCLFVAARRGALAGKAACVAEDGGAKGQWPTR